MSDSAGLKIGKRFAKERERLAMGVKETAAACGISRQQVSRIESSDNMPGGEVLAAFAQAGADPMYVLTGIRSRGIDVTLLGAVEAALASRYRKLRGDAARPELLRTGAIAAAYNGVLDKLGPNDDIGKVADDVIEKMIAGLDDPLAPELLERFLLRPIGKQSEANPGISITGSGQRIAGRDFIEGGNRKK